MCHCRGSKKSGFRRIRGGAEDERRFDPEAEKGHQRTDGEVTNKPRCDRRGQGEECQIGISRGAAKTKDVPAINSNARPTNYRHEEASRFA